MDELDSIPTLQPRAYSGGFGVPMPDPDELCEVCGDHVGRPQVCTSCRRYHRHGMIHPHGTNQLRWVCNECCEANDVANGTHRP